MCVGCTQNTVVLVRVRIKAVRWPSHGALFCPFLAKYLGNVGDVQRTYAEISPSPASHGKDGSDNGLTDK